MFRWHHNGLLEWTWPLTLVVSGIGVGLFGVAALVWATRSPGQVARGDDGFVTAALFGTVALLVAIGGRICSARILRYHDVPLPPIPEVPAPPGPREPVPARTSRRRSGLPYGYWVITGAGFTVAAAVNRTSQPTAATVAELAMAAGASIGCYLLGPAARFVVTPRHLHIDTAWRRISVPRHLLAGFSRSGTDIRLGLTDGDGVYFRVDSPLCDVGGGQYRTNDRTQLRTVGRIVTMLERVPLTVHPDDARVTTRRTAMIGLSIAAATLMVAGIATISLIPR